jgi:hypothetical protein
MSREKSLKAALTAPKIDADRIVALIASQPKLVDSVFLGLSSPVPRVRFGCSKSLLLLSEQYPDLLYPKINGVLALLENENQIIKWNAIAMIGNLAGVDRDCRIGPVLPKLYGFLSCGELITANTGIIALGKIARAFPSEQTRITERLLGIGQAAFPTGECRNIAIGKTILAMEMFLDLAVVQEDVLHFAQTQTFNSRRATAAKARAFLNKCQKKAPKPGHASIGQ